MELVTVDIGGTHARFAIATVDDGAITLGEAVTLKTAHHPTFVQAWREFARWQGGRLPRAAALSVAAPITADVIKLVNNPWMIARGTIAAELELDEIVVVNDFGAVGHAVATVAPDCFAHVAGPDVPLPTEGVISIVGPGTGLGIAHLLRRAGHGYHVQATEGGHFSFAPIDPFDDALLAHLRQRYDRVSAERVVSGPGIRDIYAVLAGADVPEFDDKVIWQRGISGEDPVAVEAIRQFCRQLGAVAGDVTLVQGGAACVIAGGIGLRLADLLASSQFGAYFSAKGRFSAILAAMPVKLITHPQPGLFGAAAAFVREHFA